MLRGRVSSNTVPSMLGKVEKKEFIDSQLQIAIEVCCAACHSIARYCRVQGDLGA